MKTLRLPGKTGRRLKKVSVTAEFLLDWFKVGQAWRVVEGIPVDAQLRGLALDDQNNCLAVFFEHPSFDEKPEACPVPDQVVVFETVPFEGEKIE